MNFTIHAKHVHPFFRKKNSTGMVIILQSLENNSQNKPAGNTYDTFHQKGLFLHNIHMQIEGCTAYIIKGIYFTTMGRLKANKD